MTWPTRRWLDTNALLIRAAAFVALLSIPFKHLPHRVSGVEHIIPLHFAATSHIVSFGLGLGLLYIASQVTLRKRNAWYVAVIMLVGLIAAELLHFRNLLQVALYAAALAIIIKDRRQFAVQSDPVSFRRGLLTAAGLLAVIVLFAITIFEVIDQRAYGRDLTTTQTISATYHALVNGTLPVDDHMRRYDHMLVSMLRVSGLACVIIVGWGLFRPLQLRRQAPLAHRMEARRLLKLYSQSSEDYFKLWPHDKHYFFYEQAFVAYGVAGNTALILDGATGNPEDFDNLRRQFLDFARLNGWTVAIIHADPAEAKAWQQFGLNRIFIGSEAVVNCQEFAESTIRNKHFRYVANKAAKGGLHFDLWQPPLSQEQIAELRKVSDAWLRHGGRREYGFLMGYFDSDYLANCQVAVLQRQGSETGDAREVIAYANLIPTFKDDMASFDHMRFTPGLSNVAMHFLLRGLVMHLYDDGVRTCNLGLAPLSKLDEQIDKSISERLLLTIKRLGSRYYSFAGLEQFKGKFAPDWEPRYLLYQGAPTRLVAVATALNTLSSYRPRHNWRRHWVIALAALVGLSYCSFPLAYALNRPLLWDGLVSELGQPNQPYAWLFNGLDIASAMLAVILAVILFRFYKAALSRHPYILWAVIMLLLSNVGALVAAYVSLPAGFSIKVATLDSLMEPSVIAHGLFSFMNSTCFVLAALLWGASYRLSRREWPFLIRSDWRLVAALVILAMSTVGAAVGYLVPDVSTYIQRLFIVSYAVWIIVFVVDLTKSEK
jgi:phosphatidylglycerol lysyltransferase